MDLRTAPPDGRAGRLTTHQQAVLATLGELDRFAGAHEVHAALDGTARTTSLSTVYRSLHRLSDLGAVDAVQRGGEALYRRCEAGPHDHLICVSCGRAAELDRSDVVRLLLEQQSRRLGYEYVGHGLEVSGRCPACADSAYLE